MFEIDSTDFPGTLSIVMISLLISEEMASLKCNWTSPCPVALEVTPI